MKLNLSNTYDKERAKTRLKVLIDKGAKIELTEIMKPRSLNTNSYQHALFSLYAMEFGEKREHVKQVVFKIEANRDLFLREHINEDTGEITQYLASTADLDQKDASLAIDRFRNLSSERGLYLPSGTEYLEAKFYIDKEIEQNKNYL